MTFESFTIGRTERNLKRTSAFGVRRHTLRAPTTLAFFHSRFTHHFCLGARTWELTTLRKMHLQLYDFLACPCEALCKGSLPVVYRLSTKTNALTRNVTRGLCVLLGYPNASLNSLMYTQPPPLCTCIPQYLCIFSTYTLIPGKLLYRAGFLFLPLLPGIESRMMYILSKRSTTGCAQALSKFYFVIMFH
jgi:hypothetical protein